MKSLWFAGLLSITLAVGGCANVSLPTIGAPKVLPVAATRQLSYSPLDADQMPVTAALIAQAVAESFPYASRYGSFIGTDGPASYTRIGVQGVTQGRPMSRGGSGVTATTAGNKVLVEYANTLSNSSGSGTSATTTTLTVSPVPDQPGVFTISASAVSERLGVHPGLAVVALEPLGPIERLAEDVTKTLTTMSPRLRLTHTQKDELDVPYPVAAVFANFERKLGPAAPSQVPVATDSREGRFRLEGEKVAREVSVKVFPYRNVSKVKTAFVAPYELTEGGGTTFSVEAVRALSEQLRRIVTD